MQKLLLIVLCGTMLFEGCYSYSVLETGDKEQQLPPDSLSIRVTLKNGSVIENEAIHHFVVNAVSNFIYGVGVMVKKAESREFTGRIHPDSIIASKDQDYNGLRYRTYFLNDSSRIRFAEGDYIIVTPDQGTGLWCMGRKSDGKSDSAFAGKVDLSDVQTIEVKKIQVGSTILLVLFSTVLGYYVVGTIVYIASGKFFH